MPEAPVSAGPPIVEETSTLVDVPVAEETPAPADVPAAEETSALVDVPAAEEAPALVDVPAAEETSTLVDVPAAEDAPALVDVPATEETPAPVEAPVSEEVPASAVPPVEEESPVPFTPPTAENAPVSGVFPGTEEAVFDAGNEPAPPARKRNYKRLVFALVAAVLVLALLAGSLVYAFVLNTPEARLLRALKNTGEELAEIFEDCKNLHALAERGMELFESGQFTCDLALSYDDGYGPMNYKFQINCDEPQKQVGATCEYFVDSQIPAIQMQFYFDEESLVLAFPQLLGDAYSVPMKDFGKKLLASPLAELSGLEDGDLPSDLSIDFFAEGSLEAFREQYSAEVSAFLDSLQIEASDESIAQAEDGLDVYSLRVDWMRAYDLIQAYMRYSYRTVYGTDTILTEDKMEEIYAALEVLDGEKCYFLIGIDDDNCIGAVCMTDGERENEIVLLLEGKQNLWDDIAVYVDGEQAGTASLQRTDAGFCCVVTAEDATLSIECNDAEGVFTFAASDSPFETQEIRYGSADGGLHFSAVSPDGDSHFDMRLLPLQGIDKLSDEPIDLFSASKAKLQGLIMEFYSNLQELVS